MAIDMTKRALAGIGVAMVGVVALVPNDAYAQQTANDNLPVSASVVASCQIDASEELAFGNYDPLVDHETEPLDEATTIKVRCTKGSPNVYVGLGLGANANGSTRRMLGGSQSELLEYELYKDQNRSQVWGNDASTGNGYTALNSGWGNLTVYGRVFAGQDRAVDDYSDIVVATVNF